MSSSAVAQVSFEDNSTQIQGIFIVPPHQTIRIGRDPDRDNNAISFANPTLSRNHLEIYSVIVDEDFKHSPLIFVRDRQSLNGTYVNGNLIGKGPGVSPARLLEDGDIITAPPHVKFTFSQLRNAKHTFSLDRQQRQEVLLFKDKYIVTDRTIGDGAHALVYLAMDVETGRQLVCKVHNLMRGPRSSRHLQRVRQEAVLLSYLDHPNVLSIKAAYQTTRTMYIFTELATGGDLYSLVSRYQVFSELEIRWIIRQVLRGVAYLHSKGVAHRDIKPENILCAVAPNAAFRIILSDFGDAAVVTRGRMKSEVGTSFYRAPESRAPEQGHDFSVDIWAVGMLTLQLFVGLQELPGLDKLDLSTQSKIDEYLNSVLSRVFPSGEMSDNGQDFIRSCVSHESEDRPSARDARAHAWLQEPEQERILFKKLDRESIESWSPRGLLLPVVEEIGEEAEVPTNPRNEPENRAVAEEDAISPHFGAPQRIRPPETNESRNNPQRPVSEGTVGRSTEDDGATEAREQRRGFRPLSPTSFRDVWEKLNAPTKRKFDGLTPSESKRPRLPSL